MEGNARAGSNATHDKNNGQVPVTHIGRAACVVVMLFMPIIIAFITASTTKKITLTPDEATLMVSIDSNHLRVRVLAAAASMLQLWWRRRGGGGAQSLPQGVVMMRLTRDFFVAGSLLLHPDCALPPFLHLSRFIHLQGIRPLLYTNANLNRPLLHMNIRLQGKSSRPFTRCTNCREVAIVWDCAGSLASLVCRPLLPYE